MKELAGVYERRIKPPEYVIPCTGCAKHLSYDNRLLFKRKLDEYEWRKLIKLNNPELLNETFS